MDFLMRIRPGGGGGADSSPLPARGGASAVSFTPIASLPPCEVPAEQQAILDDGTSTLEAKLTAALSALAHMKEIAAGRNAQLEQCHGTLERLSREVAALNQSAAEATEALAKAKARHQEELDELEERYGDEEERDRYVQDLEKELKQWRKLGSQGQQMMIQPVQSVKIESSSPAGGASGGSAAAATADGASSGGATAEPNSSANADGDSANGPKESDSTAAGGASSASPVPISGDGETADANILASSSAAATATASSSHITVAELELLRTRAFTAEHTLSEQRAKWATTEAGLTATIKDLEFSLASLKKEHAGNLKVIADLEERVLSLDSESGFRDDNLSSLYDECRTLREMALNSEHLARAADERVGRERERTVAAEALVSEMRGDLEAEQMQHQQALRQLATVQKEIALKSDAIKTLKLEMTRMISNQTNANAKKKGGAAGSAKASPADIEEGNATLEGDTSSGAAAATVAGGSGGASSSTSLIGDGRTAFRQDGAVIQVDLNALYLKVASADSWRQAWEKLRDRQQQVRSLGRTQRMAVGGIVVFALWIVYVLMSAVILADTDGDDEAKAMTRRLQVCESMVAALKHHKEDLAEGAAVMAEAAVHTAANAMAAVAGAAGGGAAAAAVAA